MNDQPTIPLILSPDDLNNFRKLLSQYIPSVNGRSHGSSITSISSGAETKITFSKNDYANNITWDATDHQFIVRTPGQYLVIGSVGFSGTGDYEPEVDIYINGAFYTAAVLHTSVTGVITPKVIDIISLSAGQTIDIRAFQGSGSSVTISTSGTLTYFSVSKQ